MQRVLLVASLLCLAIAACGGENGAGDGLDAEQQALSDAIFNQITADTSEDNPFGATEARCFSDGVVRSFGTAELTSLGLTVEAIEAGTEPGDVSLTDTQADVMAVLMTDCLDFKSLFIEEFTAQGVSEQSAECLASGFDDEFLRTLAKSQLLSGGTSPAQDPIYAEKIFTLVSECLTFEELNRLGS